jgi:hypothetical protein
LSLLSTSPDHPTSQGYPMNFASIHHIRRSGFDGFVTVSALQASKCCEVPNKPGIYLILRPN